MNVGSNPPPVVASVASPASEMLVPAPAEAPKTTFALPTADAVPPDAIAQTPQVEPPPALRIEYNVDVGRFIYLSVDRTSGETVSQIPTEEALRRILWLRAQLDAQQTSGQD